MTPEDLHTGMAVESLKGRDRGHVFYVLGREGDRLLVADGDLHPVGRPKRKNPKHLRAVSHSSARLREWARHGQIPDNHELRHELDRLHVVPMEGGAEDGQGRHH